MAELTIYEKKDCTDKIIAVMKECGTATLNLNEQEVSFRFGETKVITGPSEGKEDDILVFVKNLMAASEDRAACRIELYKDLHGIRVTLLFTDKTPEEIMVDENSDTLGVMMRANPQ